MTISQMFFDVGGVLGTGGWDTEQRSAAVEQFDSGAVEFEQRHQEAGEHVRGRPQRRGRPSRRGTRPWSCRPFTRQEFKAFMRSRSDPFPRTIAVAQELAKAKRYQLMTINDESAELNVYRMRWFGLVEIFTAFFSSCWLGVTKPSRRIYELALAMSQACPERSVFVDDREQNLPPARALGMHTVRYSSPDQLVADLAALGVAIAGQGDR